jgi:hypothetical protein
MQEVEKLRSLYLHLSGLRKARRLLRLPAVSSRAAATAGLLLSCRGRADLRPELRALRAARQLSQDLVAAENGEIGLSRQCCFVIGSNATSAVAVRWEREFRKELRLPAAKHMALFEGQFSPLRNLALFDPQLARPEPDWPDNMCVCGSAVLEGTPQEETLHEADRFIGEGEAPIVFALGSSAGWVAGDFWQHAIGAAQQLGRRSILVTGPAVPQALPNNVKAFSYLSIEHGALCC